MEEKEKKETTLYYILSTEKNLQMTNRTNKLTSYTQCCD